MIPKYWNFYFRSSVLVPSVYSNVAPGRILADAIIAFDLLKIEDARNEKAASSYWPLEG